MTARRSHRTGSLVERPPGSGRWYFRFVVGRDPLTGKLRRRAVTIEAKNKSAAQAKASLILAAIDSEVAGSTATMNQLLAEWMKFQDGRGRSPTTLNGYRSLIEVHIAPAIGSIRIEELSAHHLDSLYGRCLAQGRSPRTVRNIHNVISAALNQSVRWGWLEKSPASRATLPTAVPLKIVAPSPEQARRLIFACNEKDERLGAFVFLAAVTGCRRGEVAALRWNSLVDGALIVRESVYSIKGDEGVKSTKSGRERVVHIDPEVEEWLRMWRRQCEAAASDWGVVLRSTGFIVSSRPDGSTFVHLDTISHEVRKVADKLGLGSLHLHSLRHFAATELLAAGISARDTAEMLGHADPSLTLKVYAHATSERQRAAAGVLAGVLKRRPDQS